MATQAARDMREDRLTVFEFDCESRAREHLLDRPEEFERRLFRGFRGDLSGRRAKRSAASYDRTVLQNIIWPYYSANRHRRRHLRRSEG
jgi:hypothetical protein